MDRRKLYYRTLLREELDAVKELLLQGHKNIPAKVLSAVVGLINGGGKRLRPALVLLSTHICDANIQQALPVAAAVEMLHTATLIHDDLIDDARIRRGVSTLNAQWTPAATVLAGDIAFAWAARLATYAHSLRITERFAETLETICGGELSQLFKGRGGKPTINAYYERIFAKTASLFMLATESGAILAARPEEEIQRFQQFGRLLGEAFQIADDVLDFMGDEATLGKPVASDLRQGLITLPVIHYMETHPADARIQAVLDQSADETYIQSLLSDLKRSDAAEWAMALAQDNVQQALALLKDYPPSPYRQAMEEIATFSVRRRY